MIQLLVYSVFWLPRALCDSLTPLYFFLRLSLSLRLFLLSLLLCLLLSPTIPAGTLLTQSSPFPPLAQTALSPSVLSLFSLSSPCHRDEIKKNLPASVILSLYLSLPFSLLHFPAVGPPQKDTHTHTPLLSEEMGGQSLAVGCCMVDQACLFYCWQGGTL